MKYRSGYEDMADYMESADRRRRSAAREKRAARARKQRQRRLTLLMAAVFAAVCLFLGFALMKTVRAEQPASEKVYRSIRVEQGDTLWQIAERENITGTAEIRSFIREVEAVNGIVDEIEAELANEMVTNVSPDRIGSMVNGIDGDCIHAGNYICIPCTEPAA